MFDREGSTLLTGTFVSFKDFQNNLHTFLVSVIVVIPSVM